ncbi:uncharacterized protein LOC111941486 isoform X1 [Cyanistes caeruleus]|uniref:uncharacterized protein LOC111941486 isoform X1 n=1 Tax=Cyanistes caeruleus TaxID=156563 RepID=UPI000CDAD664|nr:uncharacterized protein LOC111941486 isoform X1 [Cyanistes caeruleus]
MLIPSWYLKRKNDDKVPEEIPEGVPEVPEELLTALDDASSETDSESVLETLPMEESDSVPGSDDETEPIRDTSMLAESEEDSGSATVQKAKTAGYCDPSKYYILGTVTALALILLGAMSGYIGLYQLLKRGMKTREDKEAPGEVYTDSSWESHGQPGGIGEAESGEGSGRGRRAQVNRFRDSCHVFPEVFAAELAQLYKSMGADPSPLPACPFCALADGASSQDHWISLDSPQPTPSWCPCYQHQQEYFILEDDDFFSDNT